MASSLPATDGYRRTALTDLFSLKGKTVVVTGGARGLGLAFSWAVAEVGANVAVLDLLDQPHDDFYLIEKELGVKAKLYRVDVTDYEALEKAFDEVKKDFGSIDCWYGWPKILIDERSTSHLTKSTVSSSVTSAGIGKDKPFLEHTQADMKSLLAINVEGSFFAAQFAAKHMKEQGTGGSIVMIASIAAHGSVPGKSVSGYCFTKGAILAGCRALADELTPYKIRVNTISPGYILTDMTINNIATRPTILQDLPKNIPMGHIGDRRDLKGAVVLLLSEASAYTTGSDVIIDGGMIAH
ncbi:hypothetical protein FQN55_003244 [Onygenales sp. PD_40]|nr:hypothetical protein FQN55_003244 [Onygenales sp. PD_40]KAK2769468.1 hypothetical protein FQN53_006154 [Emmonsiellopsis sp. PD_33]KAK2799969.1 hypothetical protein FQN51_006398 [Onygenales sp. PD_10]